MGKHKAKAKDAKGPSNNPAPQRSSGEGAGSALREMLRRQAQNPRPGASSTAPEGRRSGRGVARDKGRR